MYERLYPKHTHFKTPKQLAPSNIVYQHIAEINLTNHKINRTIVLLLCQAPRVNSAFKEYQEHAEPSQIGGDYVFDTPVVLSHLQIVTSLNGARGL